MAEWMTRSVAELEAAGFLKVEDGNHGEYRPRPGEFTTEGVVYVRAADVNRGRVDFEAAAKITPEAVARIRKGIGRDLDVLISHKGTVGRVALVPEGSPPFVCSPQTTFWRSRDLSALDPRYLRSFLQSDFFAHQLDTLKASTDMAPYVSLTQQRAMMVRVPPPGEQRAIAEVLGALDDKIATTTRLADAADGWVRAAWLRACATAEETVTIAEIAHNAREQVEPSSLADAVAYVGLEHIPRRRMWLAECGYSTDVTSAKAMFLREDVLFGKLRPYFHKVVSAPVDGVCSTDVLVVRAADHRLAGFVLAAVSSDSVVAACVAASEGTRMPRASWRDLAAVEIPWPGVEVARRFAARVSALRDAVEVRLRENLTLAATRDALLPALMSGKLRVRDAELAETDVA